MKIRRPTYALVKNNNRPVQTLNGRPIMTDAVAQTGR